MPIGVEFHTKRETELIVESVEFVTKYKEIEEEKIETKNGRVKSLNATIAFQNSTFTSVRSVNVSSRGCRIEDSVRNVRNNVT